MFFLLDRLRMPLHQLQHFLDRLGMLRKLLHRQWQKKFQQGIAYKGRLTKKHCLLDRLRMPLRQLEHFLDRLGMLCTVIKGWHQAY